ncbi:MAG TPA: oligosaccharide flippase family protein [Burkholderiaceae bacterium]|nr:oligosaccharide flippase family protein [Burkholderiaceae bacterium]
MSTPTSFTRSMKPELSLKLRSLRAGAWAGGGHVLGQIIRLAGNLILSRLLMPEAFGLMAVISTIVLALALLSDIGSGTIIVQSARGADEDFLHTAWTLQIIRGVVVWLMGVLCALGVVWGQAMGFFVPGTVYADARLPWLLAVSTFGMVIWGFVSINAKLAERQLDMKTVSLIDLCVQVVSLGAMLLVAYLTRSIWSLVIGGLVTASVQCLLTHLLLKGPRARFRLESEAVKELIGKGKWVLLSSLLGFVASNGDRMLLGGLIDSATLGLYSIAFGLATIAPSVLSAVLGKVIYPAFSEVVRERPAQLLHTYRKFQQLTDGCLGLLGGMLFVASNAIIGLLYDARYQGAGHIFGILVIGSIGVRFLVVEQIYVAMGRPSLLAAAIFPRVIVLLVGVPLGYSFAQMNGALAAIVLSQFAHWPLAIWFRWEQKLNDLRNDMVLPLALVVGAGAGWVLVQLLALVGHHH